MKWGIIFLSSVLFVFVVYLCYLHGNGLLTNLLNSPGEIGDILAGMIALITLPPIWYVLYTDKKRHERELKMMKLDQILRVCERLDHVGESELSAMRYQLEKNSES